MAEPQPCQALRFDIKLARKVNMLLGLILTFAMGLFLIGRTK